MAKRTRNQRVARLPQSQPDPAAEAAERARRRAQHRETAALRYTLGRPFGSGKLAKIKTRRR